MMTVMKKRNNFTIKKVTPKTDGEKQMKNYKQKVLSEMKKMGANEKDYNIVTDKVIENALAQEWKAEDLAWALMQ